MVLNHATSNDLRPLAPLDILDRLEHYRASPLPTSSQRAPGTRRSDLHSHFAPGDAAATAVAVTAAFRVLRAENIRCAARAAQWLTDRVVASGRPLHPANVVTLGGTISIALEAALRCSRETKLMPVARLRHRTAVDSTRPPANRDSRACALPTALWPEWTSLISPSHPSGKPVAQSTNSSPSPTCWLATARSRFIDVQTWLDLQRRLRSNPSLDAVHAQRWLFHTLTGSPAHLAQPDIAPATPVQRQQYQRFRWRILPPEAELLHRTAQNLLEEHTIDEPVQWAPRLPARALHDLALPGPDTDSISVAQLHQAVPGGDFSIAQLAHTSNTTTAHVTYLLSKHPVDWSPPRFRRTQHTATRVGQWRIWYEHDRLSLQAIADREEASLATVRLALLKNGTELRPAGSQQGRQRRR
ncbi:hypothetical protein ACFVW9_19030 [Streptomyces sp. NPDC058217]|uniref:hypothetical protein n=1 Tax=Streptomyces sp. NPDC058217 TaxID=3346384 RepID=UPI0036E871AB